MHPYFVLNAPVTEPYARDLILEAQRLLIPALPEMADLAFVEYPDCPGITLNHDAKVVFYNPTIVRMVSMNDLCRVLREVHISYMLRIAEQSDTEDLLVPIGTTLH